MARHVGDLEETCLEKNYSAFFGENVSAFWRNHSVFFGENRSEIWRTLFSEIVVGDLEKSFGDFGENGSAILEKTVRRFWRKLFGVTEKTAQRFRRKLFGDFGDRYGVS